jgi:hypothetical protein
VKKAGCFFLGLILGFGLIAAGVVVSYYKADAVAPWIMGVGLALAYFCFVFGKMDNDHHGRKGDSWHFDSFYIARFI